MATDVSNLTSTPSEYASPEQLKAVREYAEAMLHGTGQQKIGHWTQGVSNVVNALVGGHMLYRAGERDNLSDRYAAENAVPTMEGQPPVGGRGAPPSVAAPILSKKTSYNEEGAVPGAGMSTAAVDDPMVISKGTGSAFEGLPGWAPGERPIDMPLADSGKPPPDVPPGDAMAFSGQPTDPNLTAQSLLRSFTGEPAGNTPAAAPTRVAQAANSLLQQGTFLPKEVTPVRPQYSREQAVNALSARGRLSQSERDAAREGYIGQHQPFSVPTAGGTILVPGNGDQSKQVFSPSLLTKTTKGAAGEATVRSILGPDGKEHVIQTDTGATPATAKGPSTLEGVPDLGPMKLQSDDGTPGIQQDVTSGGGAPGMLGAEPPAIPGTPASNTPAVKGDKLAQYLDPYTKGQINELNSMETQRQFDVERVKKDAEKFSKQGGMIDDAGKKAQTDLPQLRLAQSAIADPKFVSGAFSGLRLDFQRLKNLAGLDPQAAVANEVFDKIRSGAILNDMKIMLQGLGQVRVAEIELLSRATANMGMTKPALQAVMQMMVRAHSQASQLQTMKNAYENGVRWDAKGKPYQGSDTPTGLDYGWNQVQKKFIDANPIVKPDEEKDFRKFIDDAGYDKNKAAASKAALEAAARGETEPPAAGTPAGKVVPAPPSGFRPVK